jgi:hypothetical protein
VVFRNYERLNDMQTWVKAGFRTIFSIGSCFLYVCVYTSTTVAFAETVAGRAEAGKFEELLSEAPHDQAVATLNAFFGRGDINAQLQALPEASTACPEEFHKTLSGRDWVLEKAVDTKVLMFNENHYGLRERVFVKHLLSDLRQLGFTHLGLEALDSEATYADGRYTPAADIYIREPLFAALLRQAESLGFRVFGYEHSTQTSDALTPAEQFHARESGQAENIRMAIENADEEARFVVFAGWSHIAKEPIPGPEGDALWMAGRLKEKTGIDPLVIDLTSCVDEAADPSDWFGRILLGKDGEALLFGRDSDAYDAQIRLPVAPRHLESPGYYRQTLGTAVFVPSEMLAGDEPTLLEARSRSAAADASAYDRVLVFPGEHLPLYLPEGQFTLVSRRGNGETIDTRQVVVDCDQERSCAAARR